MKFRAFVLMILIQLAGSVAYSQTKAFTYQGSLKEGASPANGNYDFEFKLFDLVSGGAQQGLALQRLNVAVASGIFTVSLDFGSGVLPGADRFLDIAVRPAGGGAFTPLTPRQQVRSSPYSVKSLNATTADSVTAGGIPAGSGNYIQNTTSPQVSSNFNISGTGTANILNSTQYDIGGNRVLSAASFNTFLGLFAGAANQSGNGNSFVGRDAGSSNTTGNFNSFFGQAAGLANTTGESNSFFGQLAGSANTSGGGNSFFGRGAGNGNTTGTFNSFYGYEAGNSNTLGNGNSFFGQRAGYLNTTGLSNSFFGWATGGSNTTGNSNSFFGGLAGQFNTTGENNSFFGNESGRENTIGAENSFFGSDSGRANTTGNDNSFFGMDSGSANTSGFQNSFFGHSAGISNTQGLRNAFFGSGAGQNNTVGFENAFFGSGAGFANITGDNNAFLGTFAGSSNTTGSNNSLIGDRADVGSGDLTFATAIGAGAVVLSSNRIQLGRQDGSDDVRVSGNLLIATLGSAGTTTLCRNIFQQVATCSSSLRYKTNINGFAPGLSLINRLKPITFDWKSGGIRDLGLGAEDVAAIEPLLVTYNTNGEVEGVKYDRISVVLINAVTEQQTQIETLQKINERQRLQIEAMKKIICLTNKDADLCKE